MLKDIGVDVERFYDYYDQDLYDSMDLSYAIAYDSETYGQRKMVTGYGSRPWKEFAADTPMTDKAKADFVRAFTERKDYLPGMSREEKIGLLSKISYRDYLRDYVKVDEQVLEMYQRWGMSYWCVGMDEVPAIYILGYTDGGGMPGLEHTLPRKGGRGDEPYIFHFPDGNASVARLLVRSLIPTPLPGSTMEDSVTARVDYSRLDQDGAPVSDPPEQHGRQCSAHGRFERSRCHLCARRRRSHGAGEEMHHGLLQQRHSLYMFGVAGGAEEGAGLQRQDTADVYQGHDSELAGVCGSWRPVRVLHQ